MNTQSSSRWKLVLFGLFAVSGFSGLIYESVWSNYLKFFLGHGAYAQALVLAIFMGGMALGAWISGPLLRRLADPLLGYVAIEAVIGVFGLGFHAVFVHATGFMLDELLPGMSSPLAIWLVRWGLASLLILPQAILLGATFPLMTAGVLRCFPGTPGSSISLLYFSNSIGAVFGVLCSGFWLIDAVGLPGTILAAALLNFALAILVYVVRDRLRVTPRASEAPARDDGKASGLSRVLLLVALGTGLSSFIYEVAWIRMLVMVLGASTHAFELMLSAFILGLALGGLWIRRRIDGFARPLLALGWVQLLMGVTALGTVLGYNELFEIMSALMAALQRNDAGYAFFNLSSHGVAMLVMLPVTFLAGMTLPLITYVLYSQGRGESAIGKVYAFNTLGAILGVALTTLVLLPQLGLKTTVVIGAALDLALGLLLLKLEPGHRLWRGAVGLASVAAVLLVGTRVEFDLARMSSGVFRSGQVSVDGIKNMVMHRDGRTATVAVYDRRDGARVISTNGKPDASVQTIAGKPPRPDEPTMVLTGGLPLLVKPGLQTAAVVGMGSGISANVLLASPTLRSMDVIEIEAAMVEGARHFGTHSERVYSDPRSHIHIDDAKSFFATRHKRYDLIISEPSNPWVSGVASLFSREFYARIKRHLNEGGLLVQWLQIYETNADVVSSVVKALGSEFADYRIYATTQSDIVLVASVREPLPPLDAAMFRMPAFRAAFERVGWAGLDDVRFHELGSRELLQPLFDASGAPANSDYFPFVDQHAVKARFRNEWYLDLLGLPGAEVPLPGSRFDGSIAVTQDAPAIDFPARRNAQQALLAARFFAAGKGAPAPHLRLAQNDALMALDRPPGCRDLVEQSLWQRHLVTLAGGTVPYLTKDQLEPMIAALRGKLCDADAATKSRAVLDLVAALARRDMPLVETHAAVLLGKEAIGEDPVSRFAMEALMLSLDMQNKPAEALGVYMRYQGTPSAAGKLFYARAMARLMR